MNSVASAALSRFPMQTNRWEVTSISTFAMMAWLPFQKFPTGLRHTFNPAEIGYRFNNLFSLSMMMSE